MIDRFFFRSSAAGPYALLVVDNLSGQQVAGTVIVGTDGNYAYQRAVWNGKSMQHDIIVASTLSKLSKLIDDYLEPRI